MKLTQTKQWLRGTALAGCILGLAACDTMQTNHGWQAQDPALNDAVRATLTQCRQISASCAHSTANAAGVLVFPSVTKADLLIGGAGGKGALVQNGQITDYYNIGAITAGLQAGIENTSHVYAFRTPAALAELTTDSRWKVNSKAGVTVVDADANVQGTADKDVLAYIFNAKGLHAGVALDVFDVWKTGEPRP